MSDSNFREPDYLAENDDQFTGRTESVPAANEPDDDLDDGIDIDLDLDLDDTIEWSTTDAAREEDGLDDFDAGDLETAEDLDGPLSDYDALTDDELAGTKGDGDRIEITEHEGPDLNADDETGHGPSTGRML